MRKAGIQTGEFFGRDLAVFFDLMNECGFDCIDYAGLLDPKSELGQLSESALEAKLGEIRRAADSAGVGIYQMHGPWVAPLTNNTPDERREWTDYAKKCITASAALGSPRYVVHPIMPFGVRGKEDPAFVYQTNREFLGEICECAKAVGVTVCYENMPFPWMTVYSAEHVYNIVKELDIPNLKVCLDTGHSLIAEVQPGDAVRMLGDTIGAFHVHDNFGDVDRHLMPFTAKGDWELFASAVKECVPESVPMILETAPSLKLPEEIFLQMLKAYAKIAKYLANYGE